MRATLCSAQTTRLARDRLFGPRCSRLAVISRPCGGHVHCLEVHGPAVACRPIPLLSGEHMEYLLRFVREDEGQDLVEYALLITFIALACIVGMQQLGTAINNKYNSISSSLASCTPARLV